MKLFQSLRRKYLEPHPRNEQRTIEVIQEYLEFDVNNLLSLLADYLKPTIEYELINTIFKWLVFHMYWKWEKSPYPIIEVKHGFLVKMYLRDAQNRFCKNRSFCKEIEEGGFVDELSLALAIKNFLPIERSSLGAAIIVKLGVLKLCGCVNIEARSFS